MQKIKDFDVIGCYVTLLRALGSFAAIPFCCLLFAALRLCVRFSVRSAELRSKLCDLSVL